MDLTEAFSGSELEHWYYKHKYKFIRNKLKQILVQEAELFDVGAGTGVFSLKLKEDFPHLSVTLVDSNYTTVDLSKSSPDHLFLKELPNPLSGVILMTDVLEHIEFDQSFLQDCSSKSVHGTHYLITVPAHAVLWSGHDVFLRHFRRYRCKELVSLIESADLKVLSSRYLYTLHFPLVLAYRKIKGKKVVESDLKKVGKFLNLLNYVIASTDFILGRCSPFGVSILVLAKKV